MADSYSNRFATSIFNDFIFIKSNHIKSRKSKLDPYKKEIIALRQYNMSYEVISSWLNDYHGVSISTSSIQRKFTQWKNNHE